MTEAESFVDQTVTGLAEPQPMYKALRETTPVRMDLTQSGWSDIFFLGMDFPEGARDVSMYPNITYELLKRGYSEADIDKILGGNLLRVFAQAELVARKMSRSISGGGSTKRINK